MGDGSFRVDDYKGVDVVKSDIYFTHPEAHKLNVEALMKDMQERAAELEAQPVEPSGGDNAGLA
jgi:hypothetical protein